MNTNKLLKVDIVTPQKTIYSGMAASVSVPGRKSPFQVLFNHAPIVSTLDDGIIKIVDENGKTLRFNSRNGFVEVRTNTVSILVENAAEIAE